MLSTTELASMREQSVQAFPDTCSILRTIQVSDGRLGMTETEDVVAANVPCRLEEIGESNSQRDYELAGSVISRGGTVVRLPWNTSIDESHVIAIGTRRLPVQRVIRRSYSTVTTAVTSEVR
jgi:hypothetical protein